MREVWLSAPEGATESERQVTRRRPQPSGQTMIVAHRGSSEALPEHTLHAYRTALEEGADALECDVRLTADGHLVCIHDRRVDRTSNGTGVVSTLPLAQLSELDFGTWRPDAGTAAAVLTLEDLLALQADTGGRTKLLIEVKHPTRYAGLVEHRLVETLTRFGCLDDDVDDARATVMSFAALALRRVRILAPQLPTVLLMQRWLPGRPEGNLPTSADIAGPSIELLKTQPDYVERMHAQGRRVYVWTVDDAADMRRCLALGVDAMITNRPAAARRLAGPAGSRDGQSG